MPIARRQPVSRDEEDTYEEEAPRRPRREAEPAPRRARREEPEEQRSRTGRRTASEEPRRSRPGKDDSAAPIRSGWGGHRANKELGGDYPEELKIGTERELVKFLEDEPFASYRQHWVDNPPNGIRKKSWICLGDDCPLCDLGDRPRTLTAFNVLHINTGSATPENKILTLGTKAVGQLEGFANDPTSGPLPRLYWAISKSGKGTSTAYNFLPVKERDLAEDWDVDPLTDDEIADGEERGYDIASIPSNTRKQLQEIADGIADGDD